VNRARRTHKAAANQHPWCLRSRWYGTGKEVHMEEHTDPVEEEPVEPVSETELPEFALMVDVPPS
jgi:hypothetical protein